MKKSLLFALSLVLAILLQTATPANTLPEAAAAGPSKAALKSKVKVDEKAILKLLPVSYHGTYVAVAKFSTGQNNRKVSLQRKKDGKWIHVASSTMNAKGHVTFNLKKISTVDYRAVADTYRGWKKTYTPVTTPTVKGNKQWKRLFRDSFSGKKLNKRWQPRQVGLFFGSRLCSAVDKKQTRLEDGKLVQKIRKLNPNKAADKKVINKTVKAAKKEQKARKAAAIKAAKKLKGSKRTEALKQANAMPVNGCPDGVFYNARVDTLGTFDMGQGMVAARVKFPKDQGMHGSVWLQTTRNNSVQRPAGTEIDMIESFGYGKGVSNIIHYDDKKNGKLTQYGFYVIREQTKNPKWWDKYHVYSVEWTKSEFIFRIDGIETERFKKKSVKGDRHFLAISMLASDWETKYMKKPSGKLPGLKKANLPNAKMYVDWVEAWERA
ncbi:glycoside hydrolase family 16 protein [Tessaracoccus caeni]|uniref:glycoside hydrolase family 16 protein n=1 Tax=Tessaracoccus caeni TaxID=3031239 RepID=UPI0023DCBD42|nr:family 16 glycosylhydrolase [Tessaracoccus caeni]MDF1489947.1 family 16 glycosylhydrolase [Tessaracoccus caeni]